MLRKAIFLDRDGVINRTHFWNGKWRAPRTLEEFEFLPGVPEAVAAFRQAGFVIVVVTNQPDIARGWQSQAVVDAMHVHVRAELRVDALKACFHTDEHGCVCRKPLPGMLVEAAGELGLALDQSFMVGDRASDVEAGRAAGCRTVLIAEADTENARPDHVARSLWEATGWMLEEARRDQNTPSAHIPQNASHTESSVAVGRAR